VTNQEKLFIQRSSKIMREARKRRGLKQTDVARALGVSQASISKLEAGKLMPSALIWFTFCQLTKIRPGSVLTGVLEIKKRN
jgi:DNA-binding XRE family transcriptional regulator